MGIFDQIYTVVTVFWVHRAEYIPVVLFFLITNIHIYTIFTKIIYMTFTVLILVFCTFRQLPPAVFAGSSAPERTKFAFA